MTDKKTLTEILNDLNNLCVVADEMEGAVKSYAKDVRDLRENLEDLANRLEDALKVEITVADDEGLATQEGD